MKNDNANTQMPKMWQHMEQQNRKPKTMPEMQITILEQTKKEANTMTTIKQTNTMKLLRLVEAGAGEREKRHEAEAVHLQHLGNGVEMDCSPIPNSIGTVDKEK